jgi:hypothetical protein
VHGYDPFHVIEKWTGDCYEASDLGEIGFVLHLGHGGLSCPSNDLAGVENTTENIDLGDDEEPLPRGRTDPVLLKQATTKPVDGGYVLDFTTLPMTIVHTNGVFERRVKPCSCACGDGGKPYSIDIQLFRSRLFPATSKRPKSAMTFAVLKQCSLMMAECHVPVSSFYTMLCRLTSGEDPGSVKVGGINMNLLCVAKYR